VMVYKDGRKYSGGFRVGKRHGQGKYTTTTGQVRLYDGEWNMGQMSGKGLLTLNSGDKYEGQFLKSKFHGVGCLNINGIQMDGKWQNGVREGKFTVMAGNELGDECIQGVFRDNGFFVNERELLLPCPIPRFNFELDD